MAEHDGGWYLRACHTPWHACGRNLSSARLKTWAGSDRLQLKWTSSYFIAPYLTLDARLDCQTFFPAHPEQGAFGEAGGTTPDTLAGFLGDKIHSKDQAVDGDGRTRV